MNICIVFFSYGVWGGAERLVHELAQNLAKRGQDVSLILNEEVWEDFKDISGIKLVNVGRLFPAKGRRKRNLLLRLVHVHGDMVRRRTYHGRARDDQHGGDGGDNERQSRGRGRTILCCHVRAAKRAASSCHGGGGEYGDPGRGL